MSVIKLEEYTCHVSEVSMKGKTIRTNNSPEGIEKIQELWRQVFQGEIDVDPTKQLFASYSNYSSDEQGEYDFTIANSVSDGNLKAEEGLYFCVDIEVSSPTELTEAVANAWASIWKNTKLQRTYTVDYEEYISSTHVRVLVKVHEHFKALEGELQNL